MQCCNWFIASAMRWQKCNVKTTWPEVPSTINASRIIRDNSWDVKTFEMRIYQLNILNSLILCHRSWFHWYISWMPSFKSIVLGDIGSLCEWLHFHHFTQAPDSIKYKFTQNFNRTKLRGKNCWMCWFDIFVLGEIWRGHELLQLYQFTFTPDP